MQTVRPPFQLLKIMLAKDFSEIVNNPWFLIKADK